MLQAVMSSCRRIGTKTPDRFACFAGSDKEKKMIDDVQVYKTADEDSKLSWFMAILHFLIVIRRLMLRWIHRIENEVLDGIKPTGTKHDDMTLEVTIDSVIILRNSISRASLRYHKICNAIEAGRHHPLVEIIEYTQAKTIFYVQEINITTWKVVCFWLLEAVIITL